MTDCVTTTDARGLYSDMADGTKFYLDDPTPDMFNWDTWVHCLRGQNRFSGNSRCDVWSHTLNCVAYAKHEGLSVEVQRELLFHDWEEVIFGDRTRPVKMWAGVTVQEQECTLKIRSIAHEKFTGHQWSGMMSPDAVRVDNVMLGMEMRAFLPNMERPTDIPSPVKGFKYVDPSLFISRIDYLEGQILDGLGVNRHG